MEMWIGLEGGTVVAFNNWRVLHGRSGFTGERRMVGCYLNMDDFQSRVQVLCHKNKLKESL